MNIFKHYQALVFDLDGTLADTMPLHLKAWKLASERFSFDFDYDYFYSLGGIPTRETVELIADLQNKRLDIDAVSRYKKQQYLAIRDNLQVIEATQAVILNNNHRLPVGIATGASREDALFALEKIGLISFVDVLICADDVLNSKPEPDTFAKVAEHFQLDPAKCLAFEDTPIGYQAATAAGMECLMVNNGVIQGISELELKLA